MLHWVCTACWGPVHEEMTIGGILPDTCAACTRPLMLRESHPVQDAELEGIKARLAFKASRAVMGDDAYFEALKEPVEKAPGRRLPGGEVHVGPGMDDWKPVK